MPDDTEGHEFDEFAEEGELAYPKIPRREFPAVEERRALSKREKAEIVLRQKGRCSGCGIKPKSWEYDHREPLWRGETDQSDLKTWQAFGSREDCDCHQVKTSAEAAERAEMHRKRGDTGQLARRRKHGPTIKKPEGYISPLSKNHPRYRA